MTGEFINLGRKNGNLHIGGTGVPLMRLKFFNDILLFLLGEHTHAMCLQAESEQKADSGPPRSRGDVFKTVESIPEGEKDVKQQRQTERS